MPQGSFCNQCIFWDNQYILNKLLAVNFLFYLSFACIFIKILNNETTAFQTLTGLFNQTAVSINSMVNKPLSEWHERKGLCMTGLGTPWPVLSWPEVQLQSFSSASRFMSTVTLALQLLIKGRHARMKGFFRIPRNVVLNLLSWK